MSTNLPDDGLAQPTDATNGIPGPEDRQQCRGDPSEADRVRGGNLGEAELRRRQRDRPPAFRVLRPPRTPSRWVALLGRGRATRQTQATQNREPRHMYSNQDPFWHEEWADEEAQLRADLAVEQARATKAQRELEALQANNPEALTARLAAELGQPVEAVKAQLQAAKQSTAPPAPSSPKAPPAPSSPKAPDYAKLDEALNSVPDGDFVGAVRALDQAGYVTVDPLNQHWRGGRLQFSGKQTQDNEAAYADIDQATSFEDLQNRMARHGLLEGGVV